MKTLLVGYRAQDLMAGDGRRCRRSAPLPDGDVTCHALDIYHCHAIERAVPGVKTLCSPHLPKGDWDLVIFKTGPKLMSGELSLDLLQEIHLLKPKRFELEFEGRERDRNDLLSRIRKDPGRVRDFSAIWPASLPDGTRLMLTSFPGCFCHRRIDDGGLALAEVVSRELSERTSAPVNLLDMGCGCGLVGFLVAASLRAKGNSPGRLVMVDSHARAVEAASLNSENLGIPAEVILSDDGTPAQMDGTFDVFVGNPPYYSDYRIADVFLETAQRALGKGGVCYTVCKNADGLEPVQRRYFPEVELVRRRGYAVLKSVKN